MGLIPPLIYTEQFRTRVLHYLLQTGYVRKPRDIARDLGLQQPHVERALQELVDDGWVLPAGDELFPESPVLNRDRPGFGAYVDWAYVEHGVRLGRSRREAFDFWDPAPFEKTQPTTLVDVRVDDTAVTAKEMRQLRRTLTRELDARPDWDKAMQTLYARDHNERARDLIHAPLYWTGMPAALRLLDVDDTSPERGRRWATALSLIDTALEALQAHVTRLVDSYEAARRYGRALAEWANGSDGLPALLHPRPAFGDLDSISLGNYLLALREGGFQDRYHYRHGGTPTPEQVGTVGEIAIAASLVELADRILDITVRAAGQNPVAEQLELTWHTVTLPGPAERSRPRIEERQRAKYEPMPTTHEMVQIRPGDLRTGDYLVAVNGRRLETPALVVSEPTGWLGEFQAVSIDSDPELRQIFDDDLSPVWLGFTTAWPHARLQVGRKPNHG